MTEDGISSLVAWMRAAVKAGIGMEAGSRLLLLRDPLLESMEFSPDRDFGAAWFCDWPEAAWLAEADRVEVWSDCVAAHLHEGKFGFWVPAVVRAEICTAQQIAIRNHGDELLSIVPILDRRGEVSPGVIQDACFVLEICA